jgi:hypothetical protein
MQMTEFGTRFAAKNETSFLFQILRRIGELDKKAMLANAAPGWSEWPPVDDPSDPTSSGIGIAHA